MKAIRNILIIPLLIGLIIPKDALLFIVNLPELITHFEHHQKEHEDISLIDFALKHSAESNHHDNHAEHDNLPFSHQHTSDCNPSLAYTAHLQKENLKITPTESVVKKIPSKVFFLNSEFINTIWQPPKLA